MKNNRFNLAALALLSFAPSVLDAGILAQNNTASEGDMSGSYDCFGQSFVTPGGTDAYSLSSIYFLAGVGDATTHAGTGTLYLLNTSYTGSVSGLSARTSETGLVATGSWDSSTGAWLFSGVTLNANTSYYFYCSTNGFDVGCNAGIYSSGNQYTAEGTGNSFVVNTYSDYLFCVTGTTAVPEPATYACLASLGVLGYSLLRRRSRERK